MKRGCVLLAAVLAIAPGMAMAQGRSSAPPPASTGGTAGVRSHLGTLHYGNVHGLRRGPDGQWTGKATQGGVEKSVTLTPEGRVIAR